MFRARLRPPCASPRVRNHTRNNRIKFYFAKIFRSNSCICAIFVVPLPRKIDKSFYYES